MKAALARILEVLGKLPGSLGAFFRSVAPKRMGTWLWYMLFTYLGGLVSKIFTLIGVSMVVNEFVTPELTQLVAGQLAGMPSHWVQMLALTKIDQALTVLISAMGIAMASKIQLQRRAGSPWAGVS